MAIDMSKLDQAFKKLDKDLGKGVRVERDDWKKIKRVPCSLPSLTNITSGGWPVGKIMEMYGPESSGKTTLAIRAAVDFQSNGEFVVFIDVEHSFDFKHAEELGLDTAPEVFRLYQPTTAEEAFSIAMTLSKAGVGLIIIDSVAGMIPKAEDEADIDENQMGLQARVMSKGLRKSTALFNKNKTTVIFINQIRIKIGVMFGSPLETPGGKALKFFASLRLEVTHKDYLTEGGTKEEDPNGFVTKVTAKKSKIGPPRKKALMTVIYKTGFDVISDYIDFGVSYGLIEKGGSWYTLPGGERTQGMKKVVAFYKQNEDKLEILKKAVDKRLDLMLNSSGDGEIPIDDNEEELAPEEESSGIALSDK